MPVGEARGVDVVTIGETMAALRSAGPLRLGGAMRLSVAGAESNAAIGLARLGHAVRWAGRVGADQLGDLVLRTLRAENVDVNHAVVDEHRPTGLLLFEPRAGHLVRVLYYRDRSAGSALTPADVLPALDPAPRVLHVTGITPALGPGPAEAIAAAVARARSLGTTVCLDVNYRSRLCTPDQARDFLRPLARQADILIATEAELPLLADPPASPESPELPRPAKPSASADPSEAAQRAQAESLLAGGPREVVITRGAAGATVVTPAGSVSQPARLVPVVDVVGAGDAFAAGYLSGVLDGLDVPERLDRAITTAAFAVATEGDWEGLPTREELALLDVPPDTTLR